MALLYQVVDRTGIEPVTSSMSTKRSTAEPTVLIRGSIPHGLSGGKLLSSEIVLNTLDVVLTEIRTCLDFDEYDLSIADIADAV